MRYLFLLAFAPALLGAQVAGDTLQPISLEQAVAMAQENAPAAVQARGQIRTSQSAVRSAYGNFLPSVNFTMGQSQQSATQQRVIDGQVIQSGGGWTYSTGLSSQINLFDGGRRLQDLSRARSEIGSAEANEVSQQFRIALDVKVQYYNILAARESEAAARAQLEQAEQQLRAASARVRAGAATLSDSLRSVIQVGNARLALLTAQNNVRVASAALTRLVGASQGVTAQTRDTLELAVVPIDSAALLRMAHEGPAVQQAEAQLGAARAGVRASRAPYLPTVDLRFNRSGTGAEWGYGLGPGSLRQTNTWSVNLSYPLFNNFQREDAVVRAQVARDNADAQLRDAQLLARQNIVQQLGALRTAEERIMIQQASVAAAEEDLRVQQQRYQLGASTLLDLLTSQTALNSARSALIQARLDYRVARAQIEATIGRDLQ
jgi:outer membrane protein